MIEQAVEGKDVEGFSLCRIGPKISHIFIFLGDDNLLFCRAQVEDVKKIQEILAIYETASGEKKILTKLLFFNKNVSKSAKDLIKHLLGVLEIKEYEKYLGLPVVVGRNKRVSLNYIKD